MERLSYVTKRSANQNAINIKLKAFNSILLKERSRNKALNKLKTSYYLGMIKS